MWAMPGMSHVMCVGTLIACHVWGSIVFIVQLRCRMWVGWMDMMKTVFGVCTGTCRDLLYQVCHMYGCCRITFAIAAYDFSLSSAVVGLSVLSWAMSSPISECVMNLNPAFSAAGFAPLCVSLSGSPGSV